MSDLYAYYKCPNCNECLSIDVEEDEARYIKNCHNCSKRHKVTTTIETNAYAEEFECLNTEEHKFIYYNTPRPDIDMHRCECGETKFIKKEAIQNE